MFFYMVVGYIDQVDSFRITKKKKTNLNQTKSSHRVGLNEPFALFSESLTMT